MKSKEKKHSGLDLKYLQKKIDDTLEKETKESLMSWFEREKGCEVSLKHKKPLVGNYNKSISICLDCDHNFLKNLKYGTLFDNIIGFNESHIGLVAMWECPVCFSKWFYHSDNHYHYFLNSIEQGSQKFFKE
jgi:hypothetical protein